MSRKSFSIDDLKNSAVAANNAHLFEPTNKPPAPEKKSKYNSVKVTDPDGLIFDSKKEYKRYKELKLLLKAGAIGFLGRQIEFQFTIGGNKVASYYADFMYRDSITGELIVEDVKSDATRKLPVYRLKRKMMLLQHKITIREV